MSSRPQILRQHQSPNFAQRQNIIKYIILHYTEMSFSAALTRLCDTDSNVSAHYLIKNDGSIYQLVEDKFAAWHAGVSYWQGEERLNQSSIGIEMDNLGNCAFPQQQMDSCVELCIYLMQQYDIESKNVLGHSDIAPDRKIDPGIFFDWQYLKQNGIGDLGDIGYLGKIDFNNFSNHDNSIEEISHFQQILANIGYKIDITGILDQQTSNVLRAFQSRFCPEIIKQKSIEYYQNLDNKYYLDEATKKLLS